MRFQRFYPLFFEAVLLRCQRVQDLFGSRQCRLFIFNFWKRLPDRTSQCGSRVENRIRGEKNGLSLILEDNLKSSIVSRLVALNCFVVFVGDPCKA